MTDRSGNERLRYQAVLKPLEWEQRMRVDYRDDVLRIVAVLAADGIAISEDVAFMAWRRFSEEDRCAGWYSPGADEEIRRNLMPHLELRALSPPRLALSPRPSKSRRRPSESSSIGSKSVSRVRVQSSAQVRSLASPDFF